MRINTIMKGVVDHRQTVLYRKDYMTTAGQIFSINETIKDVRDSNNYCALEAMINLGSYYHTFNGHRLSLCDHCKFSATDQKAWVKFHICLRNTVHRYVK